MSDCPKSETGRGGCYRGPILKGSIKDSCDQGTQGSVTVEKETFLTSKVPIDFQGSRKPPYIFSNRFPGTQKDYSLLTTPGRTSICHLFLEPILLSTESTVTLFLRPPLSPCPRPPVGPLKSPKSFKSTFDPL